MLCAVVKVQTPGLAALMLDKFKVRDCGVVIPHFAAPPRADVKHMVKDGLDHATMRDNGNRLAAVFFDQLLDQDTDARCESAYSFHPGRH